MSHFANYYPCEADGCTRVFTTIGSMHSHLTSARSCSWYMKGKLKALVDEEEELFQTEEEPQQLEDWEDFDPQQDPDIDFDLDLGPYGEELHFVPDEPYAKPDDMEEGEAGPGPQTAANRIRRDASSVDTAHLVFQNGDECIRITHDSAGKILRFEDPPRYIPADEDGDTVMGMGDVSNPFAPFSSELDWRVAQWAVKDGPGHNAFNRLLEIPGVSKFGIFFTSIIF